MYQRDYIMRLIEQFGQALQRILKVKEAEQFDAALHEISQAGKTLLGLDMTLLRALDDRQIVEFLTTSDGLDSGRCLVIAELFLQEGEITALLGETEESIRDDIKSLSLFLSALAENEQLHSDAYFAKVTDLRNRLHQVPLPGHVTFKLYRFFEQRGEYARAEDLLFALLESGYPGIAEEGRAFFARLLAQSDAALQQGNLPRKEVLEGLADFEKRRLASNHQNHQTKRQQ